MLNLMLQAGLILGIVAIIVSHGIRRLEAYLLVLSFGAIDFMALSTFYQSTLWQKTEKYAAK